MLEKYEVCCGLFHGFDRSAWPSGSPAERLQLLPAALEHVLAQEDGKARCLKAVRELSQGFALAVPHPETVRIRDDVSLFQHVRAALSKRTGPDAKPDEELDHAVRQIVSRAVASDGVVDIFAAAGLKQPDVSVLSEDFLREVRGMRRRNLAVELLEKLLKGELATRRRKNVVQARSFAEMLEQTIRRYQNRAVEAAQVIEELIGLAREMREANARGEVLGLSDDELAFYGRARRQRQRGAGAWRRDVAGHRPRAGRDRTEQPDHRLDAAGERPRQPPPPREARPAEARLPAGQTGVGYSDGAGAGRGLVRRLGDLTAVGTLLRQSRRRSLISLRAQSGLTRTPTAIVALPSSQPRTPK